MGNLESKVGSANKTRAREIKAHDVTQRIVFKRPHSPLELNGVQQSDTLPHVGTIFPRRNPETPIRKSKSKKPASSDPDSATLSWENITAKAKALETKHRGRMSVLTRAEEITKFKEIIEARSNNDQERYIKLRNELIEANLGLVKSIAKRFQGRGLDLADLEQEGIFAIIRGIEKFDVGKGFKFSTYSHKWIRSMIKEAIATKALNINIPVKVRSRMHAIEEAVAQITRETGNPKPSLQEIIDYLKMNPKKITEALQAMPLRTVLSLDIHTKDDPDSAEVVDMVADPNQFPLIDVVLSNLGVEEIMHLVDLLPHSQRIAVISRLGLSDDKPKYWPEVAKAVGKSEEAAVKLFDKGMATLKDEAGNNTA